MACRWRNSSRPSTFTRFEPAGLGGSAMTRPQGETPPACWITSSANWACPISAAPIWPNVVPAGSDEDIGGGGESGPGSGNGAEQGRPFRRLCCVAISTRSAVVNGAPWMPHEEAHAFRTRVHPGQCPYRSQRNPRRRSEEPSWSPIPSARRWRAWKRRCHPNCLLQETPKRDRRGRR